MIQNKGRFGTSLDQRPRDPQLALKMTDVEFQVSSGKPRDVFAELARLREFVRLRVKHPPNALELRMRDPIQMVVEAVPLGTTGRDDAENPIRRLLRYFTEEPGFVGGLVRIDFHEDRARETAASVRRAG